MTLAQLRGYATAHAALAAEQRFMQAQIIRVAVWGKPDDIAALRPLRHLARNGPTDAIEYDEDGLADELALLGFIEVPRDE